MLTPDVCVTHQMLLLVMLVSTHGMQQMLRKEGLMMEMMVMVMMGMMGREEEGATGCTPVADAVVADAGRSRGWSNR